MGSTGAALLILAILLINGIVWYLVFMRIRSQKEQLQRQLLNSGANIVIGPETANFRGSTKCFGFVKSLGVIALTERELVFIKPVGGDIHIPTSEIVDVSKNAWFLHSYRMGYEHLILKLSDGTLVGFIVKDINRWMREVQAIMSHSWQVVVE